MNTEKCKILKHELRTPLNHIAGYSGLLLETAEDRGECEMVLQVSEVQTSARKIGAVFERMLRCETEDGVLPGLESLGDSVQPFLDMLRERIATMSALSCAGAYSDDLARILVAIGRLESMLRTLREEPVSLFPPVK